jgi:lipid-A-disaccharide synthase-like uncharacterized protein
MKGQLIYGVGFLAQTMFSARLLVQWLLSEKAGRSLSPLIFWQLSIVASFLLMVYGILRDDLAIILSQSITFAVYIRNLHFHGYWRNIPHSFRVLSIVFPFWAVLWLSLGTTNNLFTILHNPEIPFSLMLWGLFGQSVFTCRFIYQILVTEKSKISVLPLGFWLLSLSGSLLVLSYALVRRDPVLIVGQLFGFIVYGRNIILCCRKSNELTVISE